MSTKVAASLGRKRKYLGESTEPTREDDEKKEDLHIYSDTNGSSSIANNLLEIFLGNCNGVDSTAAREYLQLCDLYQLRSVSKLTYKAMEFVEYNRCRDGNDYQVPFPGFPGILSTSSDMQLGSGLFTHQLASLRAMHRAENQSKTFGSLRGGILGDAPGLGKTISMLSLITNTCGLRPVEPMEFYDKASIDEHWKLVRTNPVFREEILRAIRPFRHNRNYSQLATDVSPPYEDERFPTLASFVNYVNKHMRKVCPQSDLDLFRRNVIAFKAGLDKRSRRYFANSKGKRMLFERSLIPCSTTLIIVPDALLEHWAEQIKRHVNLDIFVDPNSKGGSYSEGEGVVYVDGIGDLSRAQFPLNHQKMYLPTAYQLFSYMIVVIPFSRIEEEYKIAQRLQKDSLASVVGDENLTPSSTLLQLRWFRIIVDEGHELGENEAGSNMTKFINQLGAERRWVMSGTPTTGDEDDPKFTEKGLDQLQRLLFFLRHEEYGIVSGNNNQAKDAWNEQVKWPFLARQDDGRQELYKVLNEVMVMHKKEDLSLPKPIFEQSEVDVLVPHDIQSTIIEAVHSEEADRPTILSKLGLWTRREKLATAFNTGGLTLFDALLSEYQATPEYQELVDRAQGSQIADRILSERFELEKRGGAIDTGVTAPITRATDSTSLVDRRPIKAVVYSKSHNTLLDVAEHLYSRFEDSNIAELTEGKIQKMSYELGRFRNDYKQGKDCPICGGFNEYLGKNLVGCSNTLLEVFDGENVFLIEPERIKRAVGDYELSSFRNGLVNKLRGGPDPPEGVRSFRSEYPYYGKCQPVQMGRLRGAPLAKYGLYRRYWQEGDILCIDARNDHPLMKRRWDEEVWTTHGSERCLELAELDNFQTSDNYFGPLPAGDATYRSEVFVKLRKWVQCGRFHSKPRFDHHRMKKIGWYTGPTLADAELRRQKEDTFILLLDASLSHGLDLSFVTHMFLLEPIDDAALLEQVTSRAHRLGCTGPVTIDTIVGWMKLDPSTEEVAKKLSSDLIDESKKNTLPAVCDHCYRTFKSKEAAESHELTCDRNPDGNAKIDPFHLSSAYRDIKPPAPILI